MTSEKQRIAHLTETLRKKISYFQQYEGYDPRYGISLILAKNQMSKYIEKIRLKYSDGNIPPEALKNIGDLKQIYDIINYQENYILNITEKYEELKSELIKEKIYSTKLERELQKEKEITKKSFE